MPAPRRPGILPGPSKQKSHSRFHIQSAARILLLKRTMERIAVTFFTKDFKDETENMTSIYLLFGLCHSALNLQVNQEA